MPACAPSSKPLIDKLGVKPGMRVSVIGVNALGFLEDLRSRTRDYALDQPQAESDLIFFGANARTDLTRLNPLKRFIRSDGAIWVIYPKGIQTVTERNVMEAGLAVGLVDNKVVKFSDTLTGLRFVVRVKDRPAKATK